VPLGKLFRDTEMRADCEACGGRVDIVRGGACMKCRRVLCEAHLHGSFFRRLLTDLGAAVLCVQCRRGG
jgi:hypothetical protein